MAAGLQDEPIPLPLSISTKAGCTSFRYNHGPLTGSADRGCNEDHWPFLLNPRHRSALPILPLENDGTNTGWCEGNAPIRFPLHKRSSLGKARAIHEVGDHIGIPGILQFPAAESTLQPRHHQISAFPWLPPFCVTMVAQNLFMRN